ncbi:hypothetical protein HK100_002298, partial [Physocladia obscura]
MYTHYAPTLHQGNGIITFFNVKLNPLHFTEPVEFKSTYQAVDVSRSTVFAQEHSTNKLADVIGLSELSVRKNLNWHLPTRFSVDGVITEVELIGRTLYDLTPGKLHVVDIKTLEDVYTFDSEKDLWLTLNPSRISEYESLNKREQYQYLGSRVTIYINLLRKDGNVTESGSYYFCRHPDILTKFKILASPFFAVT